MNYLINAEWDDCSGSVQTSIQTAGEEVPLTGGALEMRGGPIDQGAGLPRLGLCPPAVPKLRAHNEETFRRRFWRH